MNDEKLMLYFYEDGLDAAERSAIRERLKTDVEYRGRYQRLCEDLQQLHTPDVAAPESLKNRLHDLVEQSAQREQHSKRRRRFDLTAFFFGVAVTAALVVGVGLGSLLDRPTATPASELMTAQTVSTDTLKRGVQVHFAETRSRLLDSEADRILVAARMIEQNRSLEALADDGGAHDLARILRAMEPVLVSLATEDLSPQQAAAMQQQLIFEINVVLTKLARQSSDSTST
ncbi:MAG: hypothetical protein AAGF72_08910 [Pseudomonadota bacterium]